jgi:PilZ domain-containing protein
LGIHAGGFTSFMGISNPTPRRTDRRWAPRYDFHANLDIEWGSAVLRANTRDISASGMFIESPDPLWVGAGFTASLRLEPPVRLVCSVKRIEPGRGMGVAITLPEEPERYHRLLTSLSQASTGT